MGWIIEAGRKYRELIHREKNNLTPILVFGSLKYNDIGTDEIMLR